MNAACEIARKGHITFSEFLLDSASDRIGVVPGPKSFTETRVHGRVGLACTAVMLCGRSPDTRPGPACPSLECFRALYCDGAEACEGARAHPVGAVVRAYVEHARLPRHVREEVLQREGGLELEALETRLSPLRLVSQLVEYGLEQQLPRVNPVPILKRDQVEDMVGPVGGPLKIKMGVEDLELVITNPSLLLGPGDDRLSSTRDVLNFLAQDIPVIPSGGINFVDARDVAAALPTANTAG